MNTLLQHGKSAHLVDEYENPEQLAEAIQTVCNTREYRVSISSNAPSTVQRFSSETIDRMEASFYQEILDSGQKHHSSIDKMTACVLSDIEYYKFMLPLKFWKIIKKIRNSVTRRHIDG